MNTQRNFHFAGEHVSLLTGFALLVVLGFARSAHTPRRAPADIRFMVM